MKCLLPHFVLCLESTDIAYLISGFEKALGYWTTPRILGNGKCSASLISSSVGSVSNLSSAADKGTLLSFTLSFGRNSAKRSTAFSQYLDCVSSKVLLSKFCLISIDTNSFTAISLHCALAICLNQLFIFLNKFFGPKISDIVYPCNCYQEILYFLFHV
jgi:hypothetical protein